MPSKAVYASRTALDEPVRVILSTGMGRGLLVVALLVGNGLGSRAGADEFDPRYVVERIDVRGNVRTADSIITRQLTIHVGDVVRADDPRVEVSRFRVLALGFFSDVQIQLERGRTRGRAALVVEVAERGTLVLNQLFFGT